MYFLCYPLANLLLRARHAFLVSFQLKKKQKNNQLIIKSRFRNASQELWVRSNSYRLFVLWSNLRYFWQEKQQVNAETN